MWLTSMSLAKGVGTGTVMASISGMCEITIIFGSPSFTWLQRAYAAYFAGILINVVGFVGDSKHFILYLSLGTHGSAVGIPVPAAATHIFDLNFFTGFGVSSIVYYILSWIFPPRGAAGKFEEIDVSGYEERMTRLSIEEDTNSKDDTIEKNSV